MMNDAANDLARDYGKAGFGGALTFGQKPCLLMVDFARAYVDKACSLYAAVEHTVAPAGELLAAARAAQIMVAHSRVEYAPGGADGGVFFRKVPALKNFERGSPFGQFVEGLEPLPDEVVVTKQYASAFFGTSLAAALAAQQIDTVIICGWSTSGCVRATALDACQSGFVPIVVREAVGDRHAAPHDANLFDLQAKYAEVKSKADALAYLAQLKR